jgi:hypothetical protein
MSVKARERRAMGQRLVEKGEGRPSLALRARKGGRGSSLARRGADASPGSQTRHPPPEAWRGIEEVGDMWRARSEGETGLDADSGAFTGPETLAEKCCILVISGTLNDMRGRFAGGSVSGAYRCW